MNWADTLSDNRTLEAIYGTAIPDLKGICIREVSLDENGPSIKLRLDFNGFPTNPPAKWVQSGFNTVQCILVLDQIANMSIVGWSKNNVGNIEIVADDSGAFEVIFNSKTANFSVNCKSIWLQKISGYLNTEVVP